jgi:hypothetical protein
MHGWVWYGIFWIKDAIFVSVRVQFDIAQGLDGYPNTMRPKKQRERLHHSLSVITMIYRSLPWSILVPCWVVITLFRLTNGDDGRYHIDLLIQYFDLYFVAFWVPMRGCGDAGKSSRTSNYQPSWMPVGYWRQVFLWRQVRAHLIS